METSQCNRSTHRVINVATTGVYLSFTGAAMFVYEKLPRSRCQFMEGNIG